MSKQNETKSEGKTTQHKLKRDTTLNGVLVPSETLVDLTESEARKCKMLDAI